MKRVRLGQLFSVLLPMVCTVSCWHPAFDPTLSLAMRTISKMTPVALLEVTDINSRDVTTGFFIPRRVESPADGFWLSGWGTINYSYELATPVYLAPGSWYEYSQVEKTSFSPAPRLPPVISLAHEVSAAVPGSMQALGFAIKKDFAARGLVRLYQDPMQPQKGIMLDQSAPDFPGYGQYAGIGFTVDAASPSQDIGCAMYFDEATNTYRAVQFSYATGMPLLKPARDITLPSSLDMDEAGYAFRAGAWWYLSAHDIDGMPRTYRWLDADLANPAELTGVTIPVVAVLSDGTLLGSDGMTVTTYSADGAKLNSFTAGTLRFVHERFDYESSEWIVVFCRTLILPTSYYERVTLMIEVFELPTLQLPSLAE